MSTPLDHVGVVASPAFGVDLPRPLPDPLTEPFWEGCREHQLLIQQCASCGRHRHLPSAMCPHCRSNQYGWNRSSGAGSVFSHVTIHHAAHPAVAASVPYGVAVVRLDDADGVLLVSNVVGLRPDAVHIGLEVDVVWDDLDDGVTLFRFAPRDRRAAPHG